MSLTLPKNLQKSVGFRLTVWYSGILILSSIFLFSLAYFLFSSSLIKQEHETIQLKLKELSAIFEAGGIKSLETEVFIEKGFQKKTPFFIRLAGPGNKTLFLVLPYPREEFNIKEVEANTDRDMMLIQLPARHGKNVLEVASTRLSSDYLLQVGKSTEDREKILRHFREIFVAVTIPLVLVGFAGGTFLASRALRPIRHLTKTIRSIRTGRMDARVPYPHTGDELEELAMLFNEMVAKIETLINGMRDCLDNVAHDLRTPMTRLRGIAEMALGSGQSFSSCREALADCIEESERILKMLSTLMDISEAETGTMKLDRGFVNMTSLLEEVLDVYRHVAEDKGISLRRWISGDLFLMADPTRIGQSLANVLDNAIKYTPSGGRIDIEAQRNDAQIVIHIKDTGIGINPDELSRIWERLYRCDQSRCEKGLGLGLSLVKAIIHAHNGRVEVFSEAGKGSTFSIFLPATN